jgi:glycerophosphoryl diester phosphodiesterase
MRLPSLQQPAIGFVRHGAASADAPGGIVEAFRRALELGATGLESRAWRSADGEVVVAPEGTVGGWPRRRRIAARQRAELFGHGVPTLAELYDAVGTGAHVALEIEDAAAYDRVVAVSREAGMALDRLWLAHRDRRVLAEWRQQDDTVRLVDSTRLRNLKEGPERRAASLADAGVDAIGLHHTDWTGGLATLFHRFGVRAFGRDAQLPRVLDELLDAGLDGVSSDHADRVVAALTRAHPPEG